MGGPLVGGNFSFNGGVLPARLGRLPSYGATVRGKEVAMSRRDKEVESQAPWQSHYIFWCSFIGIPDPCGDEIGYQCIVTIYAKFVMCGIIYYNKDVL